MSESFESSSVKCPFYKGDQINLIRCEGICETSMTVTHWFKSKEIRLKYQHRYCDQDYKLCPCYLTNMEKYD